MPYAFLVHGSPRCWRSSPHECKDRTSDWCADPWHCRIHFDINVRCNLYPSYQKGLTIDCRDKAGRSVPAPGRGALSIAREVAADGPLPILDLEYRTRQLAFRRKQISQFLSNEQDLLRDEVEYRKSRGDTVDEKYIASRVADVEAEAARQEKEALATYGMLEGADPRIAPLRRALAVWGLTADDIGVLSIHGTSTGANEANETHIWNDVFTNLNRTGGNAVPIMAQKSLCGHAKGGSAAWQLAGLLQSVYHGIIPGNRNAE